MASLKRVISSRFARWKSLCDFVADAFAHAKFLAYVPAARALLEQAGLPPTLDDGCIALESTRNAAPFIEKCGALRYWDRELASAD